MVDLNFEKILGVLKEIKKAHPNLQLPHLMQLAADYSHRQSNVDISGVSSKRMLQSLKDYQEQIKGKE